MSTAKRKVSVEKPSEYSSVMGVSTHLGQAPKRQSIPSATISNQFTAKNNAGGV